MTDAARPQYASHAQLLRVLEAARDADPRVARFGVLIGDPWEDGEQQFFWYRTRAELEHALLDAHPFVDPDAFDDQDPWREPQFDLDMALRDLPELAPDEAPALDELVNEFFCIVWIGHFDDLCAGDDPLARALRETLRGGAGGDQGAPLEPGELDALVDLLRAFGDGDDGA